MALGLLAACPEVRRGVHGEQPTSAPESDPDLTSGAGGADPRLAPVSLLGDAPALGQSGWGLWGGTPENVPVGC